MYNAPLQLERNLAESALMARMALSNEQAPAFVQAPKIIVPAPSLRSGMMTVMLASLALSTSGASAAPTTPTMLARPVERAMEPTIASGTRRKQNASSIDRLTSFRLRLGLTWAQVASSFDVSRRTVHAWASGEKLSARHEAKLQELHTRLNETSDISALKRELTGDVSAALKHEPVLKGAILSSDEIGLQSVADAPVRRLKTAQLRRR